MKFKVEEVRIPLINTATVEGKIDYVEEEPQIRIKGYKNRDEIKYIETSEITICFSDLPEEIRVLWVSFKMRVEDWIKEQEQHK